MSLLLLEGDLLVDLELGALMTSSWKIVKRPRLLLRGACEVVVELAISRVEENLAIRKGHILRGFGLEKKVSLRVHWGKPSLASNTFRFCNHIVLLACHLLK